MAGLISYIRTVGTNVYLEKVTTLLDKLEAGTLSMSDVVTLLHHIGLANLPPSIRAKLIAALMRLRDEAFDELESIEKLINGGSSNQSATQEYEALRENYNLLTESMHAGALFFSDIVDNENYIDRINEAFNDTYKPFQRDPTGTLYQNEKGELLVHVQDNPQIHSDPIDNYEKALEVIAAQDSAVQASLMAQFEKGAIQVAQGNVPEFNNFDTCRVFAKECGFDIAPYDKLKPIPPGTQREHLFVHSGSYGEYRKSGQSRESVAVAEGFGDLTEKNALCLFVDDAQKHGTEHKMLTDADRNFAKELKNADGGEQFKTINEWLDHKEKALQQMTEANHLKRPPSEAGSNRLDGLNKEQKSTMAKLAAHSVMQATRIHMKNLGADLNTRVSNRIARGAIPPENIVN